MKHADAAKPESCNYFTCRNDSTMIAKIQKAQQDDPDIVKLIKETRQEVTKRFVLKHNILYKDHDSETLLVVPKTMQHDIIRQAHEKGHFGWYKTEHLIKREFWFHKMREKIQKFINNCIKCILAERKQGKAEGMLSPIDKGDTPLETYHINHLGPMPSTKKS